MFEKLNVGDMYAGTGIGLAIVKKSMERMGGKLGVESGLDESVAAKNAARINKLRRESLVSEGETEKAVGEADAQAAACDAARDQDYLKMAGGQVIAENLLEIIPVFQKQDSFGGRSRLDRKDFNLGRILRGNFNIERDNLRWICVSTWRLPVHGTNR